MPTANPALTLQAVVTPPCCLYGGCLVRVMHHLDASAPYGGFRIHHNDAQLEVLPAHGKEVSQQGVIEALRDVIEQLHTAEALDMGYARRVSAWVLRIWADDAARDL